MNPYSISRAEKAHCAILSIADHVGTAIQRHFYTKYTKSAPSCSSIWICVAQYRSGEDQSHHVSKGRPQIPNKQKAAVQDVLEEALKVFLRNAEI